MLRTILLLLHIIFLANIEKVNYFAVFFFIWPTLDSSFSRYVFINVALFTVLVSSHCKSIYDLPLQRKLLRYAVSVFFFLASFEVNLASFEVQKNSCESFSLLELWADSFAKKNKYIFLQKSVSSFWAGQIYIIIDEFLLTPQRATSAFCGSHF